jgi:predicted amidohydrolase YtcJ
VIFVNGAILTMVPDQPRVAALAIDGDRITAVGAAEDVGALAGPRTRIVDLGGHTLMPAFVDAHAHYIGRAIDDTGDPAAYLDVALANGTATIGEAGVVETHLPLIEALVARGGVKLRTNLYLCVDDPCGDSQGDWWKAVPATADVTAPSRVAGVKIWTDGGACNRPARSSPYPDGSTGELYFEPSDLLPILAEADRLGHQIVLHALGDLAIDVAKRSLKELLAGRDNVLRHRIDHNAVLPPRLRGGYADSGGIAVIFGAYPACAMLGRDPRFQFPPPPETLAFEWAWRGLIDANPGLHVGWHSDFPVFGSEPGPTMYGFVTRKQVLEDGSVCEPTADMAAGAISIDEALQAMTLGAAYALRREDQIGSLEPDKLADLVILSDDPTAIPPEELRDVQVLATIVGGEAAFCQDPFSELCAPQLPPPPVVATSVAATPPAHNLARAGHATASRSTPTNPPEFAVDGDVSTSWVAGDFPPQWLAVQLGALHVVAGVRLTVEQTPSGPTVHRIFGRLADGSEELLAEVAKTTASGDEIDIPFVDSLTVDLVRVETVDSPSWVAWSEIAVIGV